MIELVGDPLAGHELVGQMAQSLLEQAASLLVYRSVLSDEPGQAFLALLHALGAIEHSVSDRSVSNLECLKWYGTWFSALADRNQSWMDYLLTRLLQDENAFTRQIQRMQLAELPAALVAATRQDLQRLQRLAECGEEQLSQWVQAATAGTGGNVVWQSKQGAMLETLRSSLRSRGDWGNGLDDLATHYRQLGVGLFGKYHALRWHQGHLVGIPHPDPVQVDNLVGYDEQKATLLKNTEFLLRGYPALHILLYGSRGSGKSSLVKGLLHSYADRGLRLIEVAKSELTALPAIVEQVRDRPQKFVLFVDDLSFEEDEDAYKALKVLLEGNLMARPQNVVVYATSNRRHLIREFFADRPRPKDGDEIHAWDTVQEKLSFSDRFGLTLTFEPADQSTYLAIVRHLATQAGVELEPSELEYRALQWATRHNGRSGRTARQFVDFLQADLAIADRS